MTRYGYTLFSELNGPDELVHQAVRAEAAGFDFLAISDHFHPWLSDHTDSPFAWSVLGAVAHATERIELMTLVTCPFLRYHPAVIAQAAATISVMSGGRFTLAVGAGERLNEHVVGRGWPPVDVRHEMLDEAVAIMRALWTGRWVTYRGRHLTVEDARLFTVPESPPEVLVAVSGRESIELAARIGDGIVAVDPDPHVVETFRDVGGRGKRALGQVPLSYDADPRRAEEQAMRMRYGAGGWKVSAELPNVPSFDAVGALLTREDVVGGVVGAGSDADPFVDVVDPFVDAGYAEVAVVQVGDDKDGFFDFWNTDLRDKLR